MYAAALDVYKRQLVDSSVAKLQLELGLVVVVCHAGQQLGLYRDAHEQLEAGDRKIGIPSGPAMPLLQLSQVHQSGPL